MGLEEIFSEEEIAITEDTGAADEIDTELGPSDEPCPWEGIATVEEGATDAMTDEIGAEEIGEENCTDDTGPGDDTTETGMTDEI